MTEFKIFHKLTDDEKMIRTNVFVEEQGFKNEFDEIDDYAVHIVLYSDSEPAGCIRFFEDGSGTYHLGRLAVLKEYRGEHFGRLLAEKAEEQLLQIGADKITLSAQLRVSGFYKKLGYICEGDIYYDEFCEHIKMTKVL